MLKEIILNNSDAMRYIRACLSQGNVMSEQLLAVPLEQGTITTFLPVTTQPEMVKNFEVGGVTTKQQTYQVLVELMSAYFQKHKNGVAIFEAIEQRGDPCLSGSTSRFVTHENELYYIVSNDEYNIKKVENTLKAARSYPFIGIITSHRLNSNQLTIAELKEMAINVDYILVGAYDDEGTLIWCK